MQTASYAAPNVPIQVLPAAYEPFWPYESPITRAFITPARLQRNGFAVEVDYSPSCKKVLAPRLSHFLLPVNALRNHFKSATDFPTYQRHFNTAIDEILAREDARLRQGTVLVGFKVGCQAGPLAANVTIST